MLFHAYLRNAIVYVPTVVKLQTGAYMDVDPVAVVPATNTDGLRRALLDAIARKNAIVPPPPKDDWPPPVLLKYAGVKTWSAFARGAAVWSIEETDGNFLIVGYRTIAKDIGRKTVKDQLSTGSTVHEVVERMIAILQDAARKRSRDWAIASPSSIAKLAAGTDSGQQAKPDSAMSEILKNAAGTLRRPAGLSLEGAQPR